MLFRFRLTELRNMVFYEQLQSIVRLHHNPHIPEAHLLNGLRCDVLGIHSCQYVSKRFHHQINIRLMLWLIRFSQLRLFLEIRRFRLVFSCLANRRDFCEQHRLSLQWLLLVPQLCGAIHLPVLRVFLFRLGAFSLPVFRSIWQLLRQYLPELLLLLSKKFRLVFLVILFEIYPNVLELL